MSQASIDARIQRYYAHHFDEAARLVSRRANGCVEYLRMREIVAARLAPESKVVDIGGATGIHATWLAAAGHDVLLVDPVVEQVAQAAAVGTFSCVVGDARHLELSDAVFDAALVCGPLYHLYDRADRIGALREAARVVRPGGWIFAAGVTRWLALANQIDLHGYPEELPEPWVTLLTTGRADGDPDDSNGFPLAHAHSAAELVDEAEQAGLVDVEVVGVEGPASPALELIGPDDAAVSAGLVLAHAVEANAAAPDLSGHLLAIARVR